MLVRTGNRRPGSGPGAEDSRGVLRRRAGALQTPRLLACGLLDDARVAEDAATFDRADNLAKGTPGFYDLSNNELIAQHGLEFWQQTRAVMGDSYYIEVMGTLDSAVPRAASPHEGSLARVDASLSDGFDHYFPYSDAEASYWHGKFDQIQWPVEFGYAGAWKNALDWASFLSLATAALCVALSGVFAGEYQNRPAAVALPTRRGKRSLPAAKVVAALVFAMAYWWLCAVVIVGIDVVICGAEGWSLPVQVVFGFDNPYPLTVGQTMLAVYGLGYLVALGMAALTLLLSSKMRSTMPVAVVPMAIVFLGMFALFITPLAKAGSLTPMAGMNYAFSHMASYAAGTAAIDLLRTPDASLQRRGLGFRFPPLGPRSTANRVTSREDSPRIPPRDYLQNR